MQSGPNNSLKRGLAGFPFQKTKAPSFAFEFALASSSLGWAVSPEECPRAVLCDCDTIHPFNRAHGAGGTATVFYYNLCVNNGVLAEPTEGCVFAFPGLHVLRWVQTMLGKHLFLAFQSRGQLNMHLDPCAFLLSRAEERGDAPALRRTREAGRRARTRRRRVRLPGSAVSSPLWQLLSPHTVH